ncbi:MAG: transcriptional regulator [Treponema sp. CETP13]|nr:MAG: transcriptional regulator [Treponema sp. CETP13]
MATIKEIAEKAGVSRGTVDRVLHNRLGVSAEVSEKVRAIANELGFVPNKAGKILAACKQPITIGCLLPDIGNKFFSDIIDGFNFAEKELSDFGVSVKVEHIKGFDDSDHIAAIKKLASEKHAALCLTTLDLPEVQSVVQDIIQKGTPVISLNTDIPDTGRLCYVGSNYYQAGATAAGILSLITKEPQKVLIITGSYHIRGHNERIQGFTERLKEKNIPFVKMQTVESFDDDTQAYEQTLETLKWNYTINCIFIAGAGVAGVCRAVSECGLEKKIHIIVFDDIPISRKLLKENVIDFIICQQPFMQGYMAIKHLFDYLIDGKKVSPQNYITETVIKIAENIDTV